MCQVGEICGHTYERQEDGTFLYKAKEELVSLRSKKKKSQYKEKPQYKLIEVYEKKAIERYQKDLIATVKEIVESLKNK